MNSRLCRCLMLGALILAMSCLITRFAYAAKQEDDSSSSWEGFYAGLHAGYGWGDADTHINPLPNASSFINLIPTILDPDMAGALAGGQAGYNWQRQALVFGVETDFSGSGMTGSETQSPITQNNGTPMPGAGNYTRTHQDTDWFGTLRLRAGATPISKVLLYLTGGMAYGRVNYTANTDFRPGGTIEYPAASRTTKVGWTAGAGAEIALNSRWSLKAEYLYYDLGRETLTAQPVPANPPFQIEYVWKTRAHTMNVGLNYKF